jgi:2-iminobutanoate/2-iminopropanoate deaminase
MSNSKLVRSVAAAAMIASLALVSCGGTNEPAVRRAINPAGGEVSPNFSNGILAGNTLYVAGQQGADSSGHLPDGTGPQTAATLQNIQAVLQAAGFSMGDIVTVNVYLADIKDFGDMNKAYVAAIPDPKPARTTVQAAALVNNARVEISVIAVKH